jgi:hypothetical protein
MTIDKKSVALLSARAVYLILDWSHLPVWKGVVTSKTSSEVRVMKRTIKSGSVSAMHRLNYKVRCALRHYALNSLFRPGVYVIPIESVQAVDDVLQQAVSDIEIVRQGLVDDWQQIIDDGQKRLGDLFDPSDYGSALDAAAEFSMGYRYTPIAETPAILSYIAAETYKADLERTRSETKKELEAFRGHLRETLFEIVENMRKTLTKPDGEKRVFGKRFFKRLEEFLGTFDSKNLSDDGALQGVVSQLRLVANGTDVDALKTSSEAQASLDVSLEAVTGVMTEMVQDDGSRMIDLDA